MRFWKLTAALFALVLVVGLVVVRADQSYDKSEVVRLLDKWAAGEQWTAEELLAARHLAAAGAPINLAAVNQPQPVIDNERRGRNPLDEYVWMETDYAWIDITATGTRATSCDDCNEGPFNLGFTFPFFDQDYTSMRICSNGWISPTSTSNSLGAFGPLISPNEPNNAIYGFWEDLLPSSVGGTYWLSDPANDRFIVAWVDCPRFGNPTQLYSFEIICYEDGRVILQYALLTNNGGGGVGIENASGTEGLEICNSGQGSCPTAGVAYLVVDANGIPNPPTNVAANVVGTTVDLSWIDPTQDTNGNPVTLTNVQVWLGTPGVGVLLATLAPGTQAYTHANAPSGDLTYYVRAYANPYYGSSGTVDVRVGSPTYDDGFDQGDGGWVAAGDADGFEWGIPTEGAGPQPNSAPNVWGLDLDDIYEDDGHYWVDLDVGLPVVSPVASFACWVWYSSENTYDGANLKVSVDAGATWNVLSPEEGYPVGALSPDNQWMSGQPAWSGNSNGWVPATFLLTGMVGQTPLFRFEFGADPIISAFPGFYFDDVIIWGLQAPTGATVSGNVTLDGGSGVVTQVSVRANGLGNPTSNPNASGDYTLNNVVIGDRLITGSLAGYAPTTISITVPGGGYTGADLTLRRLPPAAPTGLDTNGVDETGLVSLAWNASTDPLVDEYRIYFKLHENADWILGSTYTTTSGTQQIPASGIWDLTVRAVDLGASTPVESGNSNLQTVLYGELPPALLRANGNFDDHIHLSWLPPGVHPAVELNYDDGTSEVWFRVASPNGPTDFFAVRFTPPPADSVDYPLPIQTINLYMERSDPLPQVLLCADNGGIPDFNNPLQTWTEIGADSTPGWLIAHSDGEVTLDTEADFWVLWQFPPGIIGPGTGSDNSSPDSRSYWTQGHPAWNLWTSHDWMCRVWVGGAPGAAAGYVMAIGDPSGYHVDQVPAGTTTADILPAKDQHGNPIENVGPVRQKFAADRGFAGATGGYHVESGAYSQAPELEYVARAGRGTLDELVHYNVYRDDVLLASPVENRYDDFVAEGITYSYYVKGYYDNGEESGPTGTEEGMAAMAPAAPANVVGSSLNNQTVRISWTDPTLNANGQALVDLAGFYVYRDGVQIGTVAPGVQQFDDTPPQANQTYVWGVSGYDEIPNVGPAGTWSGSVVLPWAEGSYEWTEINATGTNTGLTGDDQNLGPFNIGFPFTFYGNTYNSVRVCSNGWISFTDISAIYVNTPIPNPAQPNNAIYGIWDDLFLPTGGAVYYYSDIALGQFIVEWDHVPHIDGAGSFTFQIVLNSDGGIQINYNEVDHATTWTTGVENLTGTDAIEVCVDGAGEFIPASQTAVTFWGPEPTYANVTGHVTFDGGAGVMTQVTVAANGVSHPVTHPLANGDYTLEGVVVGNRRLTCTLAGYHPEELIVAVPEGGIGNQNFTLVRLDPPVPTGLIGSVNSATGLVTLDWNNSADPLVDNYRVYRKLQTEDTWTLVATVVPSNATDQLTQDNVYNYAVSAVDINVSTPVESDMALLDHAILFGSIPPVNLTANGNFDDHIHLQWLAPGSPPEVEVFYDNGTNTVDGIGWWGFQPTYGWLVAHYQGNGPITVTRLKTYISGFATDGDPLQIGVFEESGGLPTGDPLGVVDLNQAAPYDVFQEWELSTPVTVTSGSFFIGMRQMAANAICVGGDEATPFINNTFYYASDAGLWNPYEPGLIIIPMQRCFVIGDIGGVAQELMPSPVGVQSPVVNRGPVAVAKATNFKAEAMRTRALTAKAGASLERFPVTCSARQSVSDTWRQASRLTTATNVRVPFVRGGDAGIDSRGGHGTLDDVVQYRVYRDGGQIGTTLPAVLFYDDPRPENQPFDYYVTAYYDNNEESAPSNTVVDARCNMAPGAPPTIELTPQGQSVMRVSWTAPTTNADGSQLVDLAGYRIYRNDVQIGSVAANVTQYLDTPPVPDEFYTWTVRGFDEVPNVGDGASRIGAVQSPWEVVDYEWIDISTDGTNTGLTGDDQSSGPFPLGFTVEYYGQEYTSVYICSNGFVSFTSNSASFVNTEIPNAQEPNTVLYPFWDDLFLPTGGIVMYRSDAADGVFIAAWLDVPHINGNGNYTFECVIDDRGGIRFVYQSMADVNQATVGVENETGTEAIQLWFGGVGGPFEPQNETAVQFWGGPAGEIAGVVIGAPANTPVEGVAVYVDSQVDTAYTAADGSYTLGAEPGTVTVVFSKPGWCDTVTPDVVVTDGGVTELDAVMNAPQAVFNVTSISQTTWPGHDVAAFFTISNPAGLCPLNYVIGDDANWLTASPATGTINPGQAREITVGMLAAGLTPGQEYQATIRITHTAPGLLYTIPVTLFVSVDRPEPPLPLPTEFAYHANYPNPFNATTAFRFDVPNASRVQIVLYNMNGQEVARPVDDVYQPGRYNVSFTADNLPSGMYIARMNAGSYTATGKLLLLK
ncbi:carboxypeptidase regulatory-like domain-containing protein [candidate division KSB1 bacterium]|nr:carboxypeptidase regulatory-like domain-containing protein [candidate division KSB1 bacterium]